MDVYASHIAYLKTAGGMRSLAHTLIFLHTLTHKKKLMHFLGSVAEKETHSETQNIHHSDRHSLHPKKCGIAFNDGGG